MDQVPAGSFFDGLLARLIGINTYDSGKRDEKPAEEYVTELLTPTRRE